MLFQHFRSSFIKIVAYYNYTETMIFIMVMIIHPEFKVIGGHIEKFESLRKCIKTVHLSSDNLATFAGYICVT